MSCCESGETLNKLLRETVAAPSVEVFKARLDGVSGRCICPWQDG